MVDRKRVGKGGKTKTGGALLSWRRAPSKFMEYDILKIEKKDKKQKIIDNCYGCDGDQSRCIDTISQDHLIDDFDVVAPRGVIAKSKPKNNSNKGFCYGVGGLVNWVNRQPRSGQSDPNTRQLISEVSIRNLRKAEGSTVVCTDGNIRAKCLEYLGSYPIGGQNGLAYDETEKDRKQPSHIQNWDTSRVTNMDHCFNANMMEHGNYTNYDRFNLKLNWDTSNVVSMVSMFQGQSFYNQEMNWNTSKVVNMTRMFCNCGSFNKDLKWNTKKVLNMQEMFMYAESFNQELKSWNVKNVTNMNKMFFDCTEFNKKLKWDLSSPQLEKKDMFTKTKLMYNSQNGGSKNTISKVVNNKMNEVKSNLIIKSKEVSGLKVDLKKKMMELKKLRNVKASLQTATAKTNKKK